MVFMHKLLRTTALLLTLFSCTAAFATASDDIAQRLSGFTSMTANFQQTVYDAKKQPIQQSSGSMALSRPGKFRWEVTQPTPQLLLADGKNLWIYDMDLDQATRQAISPDNANSPASLLSGDVSALQQRFSVTNLNEKPYTAFRLKPRKANDLFKYIDLYFDQDQLVQMQLADNLGSLSVFDFNQIQLDPPLSDKLFTFKPPKGVDVIEN